MADWTSSMQQTFEYYIVDPATWMDEKMLTNVKKATINRDATVETLGSATIDISDELDECYVRIYLVTIQNGVRERHALGTFIVQSPSTSFDGKSTSNSLDAYTPLLELKEGMPPIGYYVPKGFNVMYNANKIVRENVRAPVVKASCDTTLYHDFIADPNETWMSYVIALIGNADYILELDEMGRILFAPKQDTASLNPVWTYDNGNSSILYPEFTINRDIYGIPNVIEVIYSSGIDNYNIRVVNDDKNSPTSTVNRGREIVHRVTNPDMVGDPTSTQVKLYAQRLLSELSTLEYTISYTHAYCPVRLGDCVMLNYDNAGLVNVKAKVVSQTINCEPGCPVSEKAVFTTKLWR